MAQSYEHQLRLRLVRLNMLAAGLEVKDPKKALAAKDAALLGEAGLLGDSVVDLTGDGIPGDKKKSWGARFGGPF
jgi:hypothetical protein